MEWIWTVLYVLAAALIQFQPAVYPARLGNGLAWLALTVAGALSVLEVPISPVSFGSASSVFAVALCVFALVPPILGLLESHLKADGQKIFAASRFRGHLVTNAAGAIAAATFLHLSSSTPGVRAFVSGWEDSPAFNVVLPLSVLIVFAFVRAQQAQAAGSDFREVPDHESAVIGFSLAHWHQLANVLYLIVATFTVSTSVMYLFAYSFNRFSQGRPIELTWTFVLAFCAVLGFVFACGMQWSNQEPAVYLTFLTGTPAVLVAIVLWLSILQDSSFRNIVGTAVIGVGYTTYCVLAVIADQRGRVQWHHFTALAMSLVLAALVGAAHFN